MSQRITFIYIPSPDRKGGGGKGFNLQNIGFCEEDVENIKS